ncbi:MAG TPA: hypothetical protein VGJ26_07635, partial [Pirellulales bacterium]
MDTLTQQSLSHGSAREPFLPAESPLPMSTQQLSSFEPSKGEASAALTSTPFRRACIFAGTGVLTAGGCYEMYEVLQVGGVTVLE